MTTWISTDTHLGHKNIIKYCNRPENHEELILGNLGLLQDGDELIHLGDVCMGRDEYWNTEYLSRLYGTTKVLVRGNHDPKSREWYLDVGWDAVVDSLLIKHNGKMVWLTHHPSKERVGDINIHGHMHNNEHRMSDEMKQWYDPTYHRLHAIENAEYKPVRLDNLI